MRTLLMVLMIAGMMSTVGVYAAGFGSTPTTKTLAGSGAESVSAPNTGAVTLSWTFTADLVTAVVVGWTPGATGTYDIYVTVGGSTYTAPFTASDLTARTDSVTITGTEASAIGTAKVVIKSQ